MGRLAREHLVKDVELLLDVLELLQVTERALRVILTDIEVVQLHFDGRIASLVLRVHPQVLHVVLANAGEDINLNGQKPLHGQKVRQH